MSTCTHIAWNNDPAARATVRARLEAHRAAGTIVQGAGWHKAARCGCVIGATLDSYNHAAYAKLLGIAVQVARIIDALHERLSPEDATAWPLRIVDALVPGTDTTHAGDRWFSWLLSEALASSPQAAAVALLYERRLAAAAPTHDEWQHVFDGRIPASGPATYAVYLACRAAYDTESGLMSAQRGYAALVDAASFSTRSRVRAMADALIESLGAE